ncbi:MAG: hypothetical protein AMXMBFR85_11460 [Dehalococcoides mccartyi]
MYLALFLTGIFITALALWLWRLKKDNGWIIGGWHYLLIAIWIGWTAFGAWLTVNIMADAEFVMGEGEMAGAALAAGIFGGVSVILGLIIARLIYSKNSIKT